MQITENLNDAKEWRRSLQARATSLNLKHQERHHQKSKTGASVAHKKDSFSPFHLKYAPKEMSLLISGKITSPIFGTESIIPVWFSGISSLVIKSTINQSKEKNQAAMFVLEKLNAEFSRALF